METPIQRGHHDAGKIAAERLGGGLFKADASLVDDTDVQVPNDPSAQNP